MKGTLRGVFRGARLVPGGLPLLVLGALVTLPLLIVEVNFRRRAARTPHSG